MPTELPQPFLPESRPLPNPNLHADPIKRQGDHLLLRRREIGLRGPEDIANPRLPRN